MTNDLEFEIIRDGECVDRCDSYGEAIIRIEELVDDWNNHDATNCLWLDEPEDCDLCDGSGNEARMSNLEWIKKNFIPGLWIVDGPDSPEICYRQGSPSFSVAGLECKISCKLSEALQNRILSLLDDQLFFDAKVCLGDVLDFNANAVLGSFTYDEQYKSVFIYFPSVDAFYVPFKWEGWISSLEDAHMIDWRTFHSDVILKNGQNSLFGDVDHGPATWKSVFRSVRVDKGLARMQLSELAGIPLSEILRVEEGDKTVSLDVVTRLASVLGIDLSARRRR